MRQHRPAARRSSTSTACARTFFVLGWVAERYPGAGARDRRRAATRSPRTATAIGWSTTRRRRRSATTCGAPRRCSKTRPARAVRRLPGAELLDHRAVAVGARRADRGGLHATTPASSRSTTIATAFPTSPRHAVRDRARAGGLDRRSAGSTVRVGGHEPAGGGGGYFRLLPYAWTRWGIARRQPASKRQPAMFYLHPWEIDPEQPRLPAQLARRGSGTTATCTRPKRGCARCCATSASAPSRRSSTARRCAG